MRKENNTKKYIRVKQILSLAMIISMLLCLMRGLGIDTTVVYGETNEISGTCGENLTWSFDESTGVLDITGEGEMDEFFSLYYDQVYYHAPWRKYQDEIETVNISRGVTNISAGVFEDCDNLTNISIPDSVIKIEGDAFSCCHHLTNIEIPNSVTIIGGGAFGHCSSITDLTIPNSVTIIGGGAFEYCSSITDLTISNGVTSIGYRAFERCSSITDLTIPSSVTVIDDGAFSYCSGLKSIKVDENNKKYDSRNNCNAIVSTEENKLLLGCINTIIPNNI